MLINTTEHATAFLILGQVPWPTAPRLFGILVPGCGEYNNGGGRSRFLVLEPSWLTRIEAGNCFV